MAELKTQQTDASVEDFLNKVEDEKKRKDSFEILELIRKVTGEEPKMWGPGIVGFGTYRLKYPNGREIDWMLTGFSPRKQNLTIYIMTGFDHYEEMLQNLGKFKTGKSCLYIKKIEDINKEILERMIRAAVEFLRNR